MSEHKGDGPHNPSPVERDALTPHAENMHHELHAISDAVKNGGPKSGASDNSKNSGGNKAVDSLPKVDFYDSRAGGGSPTASDRGAAGGAGTSSDFSNFKAAHPATTPPPGADTTPAAHSATTPAPSHHPGG